MKLWEENPFGLCPVDKLFRVRTDLSIPSLILLLKEKKANYYFFFCFCDVDIHCKKKQVSVQFCIGSL